MRLYRSVVGAPYTGPGSFWSPDPSVSERYGKRGKRARLISTDARGRTLEVSSDDELIDALTTAGISNAEERVLNADWFEDDVYAVLRRLGYRWVVRPVDLEISARDVEWIYVGKQPLRWASA